MKWICVGCMFTVLLGTVSVAQESEKPIVWIISDMSDSTLEGPNHQGTINDPDDISAMAGYLLMANRFDTRGIVVTSTNRIEHRKTPNQADWANAYFGEAYRADVKLLNENLGGYPEDIEFVQSCIKSSGEKFDADICYESLDGYASVKALFQMAAALPDDAVVNVLCWGSLTEPAILVNHCLVKDHRDVLRKFRFIAHWTNSSLHQGTREHPEAVANCREDASACAYLKGLAEEGVITYHECGAIGQHGIVRGGPKGLDYFDAFRQSQLGKIFVEGKFVQDGVDHSDSATYWTLLGEWGVSLEHIAPDGTNPEEVERANEARFRNRSSEIHDELLRRSNMAAPK